MALQKQAVVELVQAHRGQGRTELLPVEEERGSKEGRAAKYV